MTWGQVGGSLEPPPILKNNKNKMKNKNRNKNGQFTSIKSYWNKNRKKWLVLVCVTILAYSGIFFTSDLTNSLYSITASVEAHVEDDKLEEICSLPYVDCGTPEQMDMKEWIWVKLNQNLGYDDAVRAMAIIQCESGFNPDAMNVNTNGTVDLGLVQINHPLHSGTISRQQSLDYQHAINWMINKRIVDGNFSAWVCNRLIK